MPSQERHEIYDESRKSWRQYFSKYELTWSDLNCSHKNEDISAEEKLDVA